VPEGFRETIMRWGLWCCRVLLFERDHDGGFRAPHAYPAEAVASFNTHDLPSYQGWLTAHDLHVKRGLGLDPGENDDQRAQSQHRLRTALAEHASHHAADDAAAMAAFLGATPSRLAVIALDDVLGMRDQVNIPGTTTEHPNWRRKLSATIEELADDEGLRRVAEAFAEAGRAISR